MFNTYFCATRDDKFTPLIAAAAAGGTAVPIRPPSSTPKYSVATHRALIAYTLCMSRTHAVHREQQQWSRSSRSLSLRVLIPGEIALQAPASISVRFQVRDEAWPVGWSGARGMICGARRSQRHLR